MAFDSLSSCLIYIYGAALFAWMSVPFWQKYNYGTRDINFLTALLYLRREATLKRKQLFLFVPVDIWWYTYTFNIFYQKSIRYNLTNVFFVFSSFSIATSSFLHFFLFFLNLLFYLCVIRKYLFIIFFRLQYYCCWCCLFFLWDLFLRLH